MVEPLVSAFLGKLVKHYSGLFLALYHQLLELREVEAVSHPPSLCELVLVAPQPLVLFEILVQECQCENQLTYLMWQEEFLRGA